METRTKSYDLIIFVFSLYGTHTEKKRTLFSMDANIYQATKESSHSII